MGRGAHCSLGARTAVADAQVSTPQRGFALPSYQVDGYDGPDIQQSLREIADVGATWVELTPSWQQQTRNSNEMVRTSETVSDTGLEE